MTSYSEDFDDAHWQANAARDEWRSSPNPETRARVAEATRKWVLMLEPVIGRELAIEYENSAVGYMDAVERRQKLVATHAEVQATDASALELSKAEEEEYEADARLDVAIDTTAKALINAELRDLTGTREDWFTAEFEALMATGKGRPKTRKSELIVTYWLVRCPYTKFPARCAGYMVDNGLEIRVLSNGQMVSRQHFGGLGAREAMDAHAALALEELLKKGYMETRSRGA